MEPKKHERFSPYTDNGGTLAAIAGKDYAIIASDTRLSSGYSIYTREQTKLFPMTPEAILGSSGCWCDVLTFTKVIGARIQNYRHDHNRSISTPACAQLMSIMLYNKRFFPYYVSNLFAGLDEQGKGVVYSYDPVGSYHPEEYGASGSASGHIMPLLDSRFKANGTGKTTLEEAVKLIQDAFTSASERDIYVGDSVDIRIITSSGVRKELVKLRRD